MIMQTLKYKKNPKEKGVTGNISPVYPVVTQPCYCKTIHVI